MSSLAASERAHLSAAAQQVGPDAPTLCGEWTVRDLVVHLLVREGSPAALGIVVPPLGGLLDRATRRLAQEQFDDLVERLRHGPPVWSPFALPKVGAVLNQLEFFVHHEDIRRAQPRWRPALPPPSRRGRDLEGSPSRGQGARRQVRCGCRRRRRAHRHRRAGDAERLRPQRDRPGAAVGGHPLPLRPQGTGAGRHRWPA